MKKVYILICLLLLIILVDGCVNKTEPEILPPPDEPASSPEQNPADEENPSQEEDKGVDIKVDAENHIVFDFAELPEKDFPRGLWSINQLIDLYGPYENLEAVRCIDDNDNVLPPSFDIVLIKVLFKNVDLRFAGKDTSYFSFYKEVQEPVGNYSEEECTLSETDKDIGIEVVDLTIYDTRQEFPHGIKIGKSMKSDVLSAYPEGSAFIRHYTNNYNSEVDNYVYFIYGLRDENGNLPDWDPLYSGCVNYQFDKADVLQSVYIAWRWFSW